MPICCYSFFHCHLHRLSFIHLFTFSFSVLIGSIRWTHWKYQQKNISPNYLQKLNMNKCTGPKRAGLHVRVILQSSRFFLFFSNYELWNFFGVEKICAQFFHDWMMAGKRMTIRRQFQQSEEGISQKFYHTQNTPNSNNNISKSVIIYEINKPVPLWTPLPKKKQQHWQMK